MKRLVTVVQVAALAAAAFTLVMLFANEPEVTAPVAADGGGAPDEGGTPEDGAADPAPDGAAVYADRCAGCHGPDGSGGVGPALSGGAVVEAYPDEADQVAVITEGRNGMPAFGGTLSAEEIQAVTAYTRNDL